MKNLLEVFFRTFAALVAGPLLVVSGQLAGASPNYHGIAVTVFLAVIGAAIGALVAVGHTLASGRASTPAQKALRALVQGIAQLLGALTINSVADVISLPHLLLPLLGGVVVSAIVTYLQNVAPAPVPAGG